MSLTPEQKQTVAAWVAAGDNLSTVQQKLTAQFKISLTYRDVRFLVDDLNLELKDPAPKVDASDVSKAPPTRPFNRSRKNKAFSVSCPVHQVNSFIAFTHYTSFRSSSFPLHSFTTFISLTFCTAHKSSSLPTFRSLIPYS